MPTLEYSPFIFEEWFSCNMDSQLQVSFFFFSFSSLNMSSCCSLDCMISDERLAGAALLDVPYIWQKTSLFLLSRFSSWFGFQSLILICLCVHRFTFIILGIHSVCWTCRFLSHQIWEVVGCFSPFSLVSSLCICWYTQW